MEVERKEVDDPHAASKPNKDDELPQCKIKRNYSCNNCVYFTQNPRIYLTHLRDIHGERIIINKCILCLYASRHYQKLVRHMKMVHGSTEGLSGPAGKRISIEVTELDQREVKVSSPPSLPPTPPPAIDLTIDTYCSGDFAKDLEASRNAIRDLAGLYFAKKEIGETMKQMEESDAMTCMAIKRETCSEFELSPIDLRSKSTQCQRCKHWSYLQTDLLEHEKICYKENIKPTSDENNNDQNASTEIEKQPCSNDCNGDIVMKSTGKNCKIDDIQHLKEAFPVTENRCLLGFTSSRKDIREEPKSKGKSTASSVKRVFKCPRCPYWALNASRFHVHIIGHLNTKPFKCSLCAYQSNWRWDITKHIRIKALQNPNHGNARVVMSDETGRRNYTKYNKYLTLMNLSSNGPLVKSNELNKLLRVESLNNSNNPDKVTIEQQQLNQSTFKSGSDQATTKTKQCAMFVPEAPNKESNTKQQNSQSITDDIITFVQIENGEKKTYYKCRRCYFRFANREVVMAHVELHNTEPTSAASFPSKLNLKTPFEFGNRLADSYKVKRAINDKKASKCSILLRNKSEVPPGGKKNVKPNQIVDFKNKRAGFKRLSSNTSSLLDPTGSIHPNLAEKPTTNLVTGSSMNFSKMNVNESRRPPPFRCGKCHQVSNWKHVIQRHCRLKHSGLIQIEAFDECVSTYRPLDWDGSKKVYMYSLTDVNDAKDANTNQSSSQNKVSTLQESNTPLEGQFQMKLTGNKSKDKASPKSPYLSFSIKVEPNRIDNEELKIIETFSLSQESPKTFKKDEEDPQTKNRVKESVENRLSRTNTKIQAFSSLESQELSTNVDKYLHNKNRTASQKIPSYEIEKCSHCPFESVSQKTLKHHICISKHCEKHACDRCQFSSNSEKELADHAKLHQEAIGVKEPSKFFTNLELEVKQGSAEKIDGSKAKSKKSPPLQPLSSQKTILVNPKTGQIIPKKM